MKRLAILRALAVRTVPAMPAMPAIPVMLAKPVILAVIAALAASGIAMSSAVAQPSSKARSDATAAYQEGQRRYLDEDYAGAAAQFEAAHKLDPDPAYLFNIAQAYRLAKDCGKALAFYKQFLAEVPKAPNADAVKKYIRELEAQCPASEQPVAPPPVAEPTRTVTAPARIDPSVPQPPRRVPSHLRRNLALGATALGVAGIASGVVFTFKVGSDEDEREKLCPSFPCEWTPAKRQREAELKAAGDRHSAIMVTSYLVGGVAVAAAAVLLISERSDQPEFAVMPTRGGAYVGVTLAY